MGPRPGHDDRAVLPRARICSAIRTAIASLHAETPCDWAQGAETALRIVDQLALEDFRYLHSTRAELLRRLGRTAEARAAFRRARQLADDGPSAAFSNGGSPNWPEGEHG